MKFMLDTNMCIYVIKKRPQRVLDRFNQISVGDIGISVITLSELEYGVSKSSRQEQNHDALDEFVSPLEVAAFDRPASVTYGRIRVALEKKGQTIGSMDMLIAAHAITIGVQLITNNEDEFKRVPGLRIDNWTK